MHFFLFSFYFILFYFIFFFLVQQKKSSIMSSSSAVLKPPKEKPPVDFTKQWTNGHKTFTSAQCRALNEMIHTEDAIRGRFEKIRSDIKKPRNPLTGEPTPRDIRGNVVLNPGALNTVNGGIPLYDSETQSSGTGTNRFSPKTPMGKIGVTENKYDILGNTETISTPAQPGNLDIVASIIHERRKKILEDQTNMAQLVAKEKAKRHQKQLERDLYSMRKQMDDKAAEIQFLKERFNI
jgi:hypothetical protein